MAQLDLVSPARAGRSEVGLDLGMCPAHILFGKDGNKGGAWGCPICGSLSRSVHADDEWGRGAPGVHVTMQF